MSITKTHDNLLPRHGDIDEKDLAAPSGPYGVDLEPDASGCFAIVGPLELCYDFTFNPLQASVSLKVGPVTVAKGEVAPGKPLVLKGDYYLVSWEIDIAIEDDNGKHCLTMSGKACAVKVGCKSFNDVHIFCI